VTRPGYTVVTGPAGALSVWPDDRPLPVSWSPTAHRGSTDECLDTIERIMPALIGPDRAAGPDDSAADSIVAFFAASRRRHPDRPAVSDDERSLTYAELDAASDRVAAGLRARDLDHEARIAVYLPRCVHVFVALLGILKAGGVYVPIDTSYSAARRDMMIRASGASLVITTPDLAPDDVPACTVDELAATPSVGAVPVTGSHAACVLFTSGSTGQPKAIVLEHRNIAYFARNTALPTLRPDDRVGHVSSLSFDAFHFDTWCSLAAGAEIVVLPTMPQLVAGDAHRELRRRRITAMLVPTMAVNHVVREDHEAFASLRILHTGGDVIVPSVCRDLLAGGFRGEFWNLYGPSECATACTGHRITEVPDGAESVPIGTDLAGAQVHVLGPDGRVVRDGCVGELYIGGAGVGRGYLGQPRETATRFVPDPFAPGGGRLYRTGDLGRRRPDGRLEFVARADDQVKIRGYRVEPREVERILIRHEGVLDAAVVAVGDDDSRHLVALVVSGTTLSLPALRQAVADVGPDYLVPSAILALDRIPANAHGKRDTAKLRELAKQELDRRRRIVAPRDDVERHLANLWRELLAVEEVGLEDDFYALGGNSMLAFRFRRRVTRDLGVTLDMHDVLGTPVLAGIADLVRARTTAVDA
jgi:amino acid adenylation domain-containing protein